MCSPEHIDHFLIFYPAGKVGGAQILRCQWIAVNYDGFTLGALALNPSDFLKRWGIDIQQLLFLTGPFYLNRCFITSYFYGIYPYVMLLIKVLFRTIYLKTDIQSTHDMFISPCHAGSS